MLTVLTFTRISCLTVALAFVVFSGCDPGRHVHAGPVKTDEIHIDRGAVERANIELNIGAGELNVDANQSDANQGKLLSGELHYNAPELEPVVKTSNTGSHAAISIRQPSGYKTGNNGANTWNVHMNSGLLWDIAVNCGAGKADLALGSLPLRSLEVHIGVGQVDVNLDGGTPKHDYDVDISGGIGQATIQLPKNVGIRVEAHGGLGSIDVNGLDKQGDHYQNALYDNSKVNVNVRVNGGIGEIKIIG